MKTFLYYCPSNNTIHEFSAIKAPKMLLVWTKTLTETIGDSFSCFVNPKLIYETAYYIGEL